MVAPQDLRPPSSIDVSILTDHPARETELASFHDCGRGVSVWLTDREARDLAERVCRIALVELNRARAHHRLHLGQTEPQRVPARKVTGPPRRDAVSYVRRRSPFPTDAGQVRVLVLDDEGRWVVSSI